MKNLFLTAFALFAFSSVSYNQNPGDPVLEFGENGYSTIGWSGENDFLYSIELQNNKIIAAGKYETTSDNLLAVRLTENGTLDEFGNNPNWFEYDFGNSEHINSLHCLPDGSILVAGKYISPYTYPFVIKLQPNGEIDSTFGVDGVFTDEDLGFLPEKLDIIYTTDSYKIILCGYRYASAPELAMLDKNGNLDPSFAGTGMVQLLGYSGRLTDLIIDTENECIYSCGNVGFEEAIVTKFFFDGTRDFSFADNGVLNITVPDCNSYAKSIEYNQETGMITVFGYYQHPDLDYDIFAVRVSAETATPDNTFGINGWASLRLAVSDEYIFASVSQFDGKYYFGGRTNYYGDNDFMLGRINENGTSDLSFGENGFVIEDFEEYDDIYEILLNDSESRIYVGGTSRSTSNSSMKIGCYYTGEDISQVYNNIGKSKAIRLYPNPSKGIVNISFESNTLKEIEIKDIVGKTIQKMKPVGNKISLDIREYQSGMYFILTTDFNNKQESIRIIKQ